MLAPVNHILGLTNIRRQRLLPVAGKVLVRVGQKVSASDFIAEANVATRHILLDIRRSLGGVSAAEVERLIVRHEGDKVQSGDVVAEKGGLFSRIVRAPVSGTVVMVAGGRVLLEVESQPLQIQAATPGIITEIIPERGATIETNGALIQGAWGNGLVSEGTLVPLLSSPEDILTSDMLDVNLRGAIVAAGHCRELKTLRAGADLPLRGLVLGSISSDLLAAAAGMQYPIMVLEGFGHVPMNEAAFRLIVSSEKRDVSINAVYNPPLGERPELIIPLAANGPTASDSIYFQPDQTVRIQGDPYRGKMGVIVQIRPGLTVLPNGLRAPAADIRLESDHQVTVPLANLEVIA
jgi:hypothetical protein